MDDEEFTFDFSKIKNFFTKKKKKQHSDGDDETIDISSMVSKSKKYLVPLLILIPILLSIFFRMQPFYLPITDTWAESTVMENLRAQISNDIDKQYANLPEENKQSIIQENIDQIISSNPEAYRVQVEGTSDAIKSRMQDESGQTYLLAIDPYLWYGNSKNYIENKQLGNTLNDGEDWYDLRNGRLGRGVGKPFNSYMTIFVYKLVHPFKDDFSVLKAAFLIPLLIMALAVIPVFFIGRKFAGNIGGFFAATIFAIHPALLNRTVAGFSDTDPYTIFFPLATIWLFFEALDAKNLKTKITYISLSGLSLSLFNIAWGQGWWYTFDFILATLGIYLVYFIIMNFRKMNFREIIKSRQVTDVFTILISLAVSFTVIRGILSFFFRDENLLIGIREMFNAVVTQPLWFIQLKQVAGITLWPNVLTTVAELNPSSLKTIINSIGGMELFAVSIVGLVLVLAHAGKSEKEYLKFAILIAIWFVASIYAAMTSLRFIALIVPVFALAFGAGLGLGYRYLNNVLPDILNINKKLLSTVLIIIFLALMIKPVNSAWNTVENEIPSFTDAWDESLAEIREASGDAIITSWWDFGHWFVAMGERRVTFDGGDQGNRIHWVGKSLLTDNEDEAVGILRMLNCGQELAYDTLENMTGDSYGSKLLLDELVLMDRTEAGELLEEAGLDAEERETILGYTHCDDIIDQYYITSGDMVGKASVWGHFGSWDFERANMYNSVRKLNVAKGKKILMDDFGLSEKDADKSYYEIKSTPADQWITGWPSFVSEVGQCAEQEDILFCQNGLMVNMTDFTASLALRENGGEIYSLVYAGTDDIIEKKMENPKVQYSAALFKEGDSYRSVIMDPRLAKSTFTRLFFFDGLGSKYFRILSDKNTFMGLRIQVWNVSFEPMEKLEFSMPIEHIIEDMIDSEVSNLSV